MDNNNNNNNNQYENIDPIYKHDYNSDELEIINPKPHSPQKSLKRFAFFRFVSIFIMFVFLGGVVFGAGYGTAIYLGSQLTPNLIKENNQTSLDVNRIENIVSSTTSNNSSDSIAVIAKTAGPSVVTVTSTISFNSVFNNSTQKTEGTGSGIIYDITDDNLLIITNHHVIEDSSNIEITLQNGVSLHADVVGYDSRMDLAVLSLSLVDLNAVGVNNITVATFGDSTILQVGELAVAIGNPLGKEFSSTVTAGVISAINRELNIDGSNLSLLQTDAAINPGNSGGALVNSSGEVIGINTAKFIDEKVEGMGFSIPTHIALPVIRRIIESDSGTDEKPFLGVKISDINEDIYNETGMPFGIYIIKVYENSAAEIAGLQAGDVIFSIDKKRLVNSADLFNILSTKNVGDTIIISISRGDENFDFSATLSKYSDVITD